MNAVSILLFLVVVVGVLLVMRSSGKSRHEGMDGGVDLANARKTWVNGQLDDIVTDAAFQGNLYSSTGLMSEYIIA